MPQGLTVESTRVLLAWCGSVDVEPVWALAVTHLAWSPLCNRCRTSISLFARVYEADPATLACTRAQHLCYLQGCPSAAYRYMVGKTVALTYTS